MLDSVIVLCFVVRYFMSILVLQSFNLSSWCLVMVERLFLAVPMDCLRFLIVVFPDHTHLLFLYPDTYSLQILSLNSAYAIIERYVALYCDYPLDNVSTLEINLTKHLKISTLF